MKRCIVLAVVNGLASALASNCISNTSQFDPVCYDGDDIITRDVAVIGGGSSGTYAAIKLKDMGKSVVIVERASLLGGHTNTYTVPNDSTKIDFGVIAFWNTSLVTDFFARFDVPVSGLSPSGGTTTVFTDFKTGQRFSNFTTTTDLSAYAAQVDKYSYLPFDWDLPNPVPQDLLLTFGEFVEKYSLQDVAFSIYNQAGAGGLGNILQQSTVTVLKAVGQVVFQELQGASITTAHRNNQELYEKALTELGSNVLLNSSVISAERPANSSGETGVRLVVKTSTGNKLLVVSQTLISIPPKLDNMSPFGLDGREQNLFQQLNNTGFYCGLINNTGLPTGQNFINIGTNTLYHIPTLPGLYHISPTAVDGIFSFWYGSPYDVPQAQIQQEIAAAIRLLLHSGSNTTEQTTHQQQPDLLAYSSHTPYNLNVPPEAVRAGFYDNLDALQGYRNTWYTGGLFTPAAGPLWVFTQALLPKVAAAI
ncbi:hypothetical protein BDR22DRAFT_473633 [Usnea florida]